MTPADRGVSEGTTVAALIFVTLVATASVGLSALVVDNSNESSGGFDVEFQFSSNLAQLTIFPANDNPVQAGNVVVSGPNGNSTWAELAELGDGDTVEDGDQPVFVSEGSPYGGDITTEDTVYVVYTSPDGETTTVAWNEGDSDEEEGGPTPPGP